MVLPAYQARFTKVHPMLGEGLTRLLKAFTRLLEGHTILARVIPVSQMVIPGSQIVQASSYQYRLWV